VVKLSGLIFNIKELNNSFMLKIILKKKSNSMDFIIPYEW
jgi:hypothetical protein